MKKTKRILAMILVMAMGFSFASCAVSEVKGLLSNPFLGEESISMVPSDRVLDSASDADPKSDLQPSGSVVHLNHPEKEGVPSEESNSLQNTVNSVIPSGEYEKGVLLVKAKGSFAKSDLGTLVYLSAEPLYQGSKWYSIKLSDPEKTEESASYLDSLGTLEKVDFDYVMSVDTTVEAIDVSGNPHYGTQKHHHAHRIPEGWKHIQKNGKHPGGSSDVVVAVIDTGVDYNHLDLRNNIWANSAEIPANGKDDDGNGYVDDVHGWDFVGNDKDPMDDNGHGTHVAGIVAAENNKEGGIGVAYNCKVMVLKAGNSSGYFNSSDVAEAIQYAYMNGASVINMSFGGPTLSLAVEDALEDAYNQCVLVAAAGNNGLCNQLGCPIHMNAQPMYPAALPYVIGVMSTDVNARSISYFSNFDHYPYNSLEYEVFAVGEAVPSTWPGNRYATLNGTSMAAPTVSGIAALLRSAYPDREMYSTKFIQSQIVNTGSTILDGAHCVADVVEALTQIPKPQVNLYDYAIDDSASISPENNGNGVVDAGETIRLSISLHNRGGVAENVAATIDTIRSNGIADPYFDFKNSEITLSDIGTYSVCESGEKHFEIIVSPDCPNDYLANFNIRFCYTNGMDENDKEIYRGSAVATINVSRGFHLPAAILENTSYKADRLYIVGQDVVIPEGITVTFEEGCQIQFYEDREFYDSPKFIVYGTLNFEGSAEKMVKIFPNALHKEFRCCIVNKGTVNLLYTDATNLQISDGTGSCVPNDTYVTDSHLRTEKFVHLALYEGGKITNRSSGFIHLFVRSLNRCRLEFYKSGVAVVTDDIVGSALIGNVGALDLRIRKNAMNNVFCTHSFESSISGGYCAFGALRIQAIVENNIFTACDNNAKSLMKQKIDTNTGAGVVYKNNEFSEGYQQYASQVLAEYYDSTGTPTVDVYGSLADASLLWPYVVRVEMFDREGNPITTVGREEIKVRVTFNRPMNTTKDTFLTFGTIKPYADYKITGSYVSDTVWEGSYTLKAQIENGQNFLRVENACAAEDSTKAVLGEYQLYEFTVDTTEAMAMNLQAFPKENGIELHFVQDDYDTLLGYNIYRSTEKDGNYTKLNRAILLPEENVFLDDNAEPGKTYWYTYTVVLSDFSESNPAGKVQATAMDTLAPSIYHTPVNQGYENNNLVISCTASDNVGISKVTLYYRAVGVAEWKSLSMVKQNDKFSATIFGSDVTLAGLEYYIVASDGINTVQKGFAESPYTVLVKSADSLLGLGDVDGNGSVTTKDALMLMQCLNGDLILSDDAFRRADLNKDGILSSVEALRILQYINGKVTTLEM